tara:strand:- start:956 stop:1201 length:246 start_codon:yes stop_codon:yes gene_type:complete
MKRKPHKIKSLKIRLYEIEKLLDKMSRRSKRQVKSLFKGWVDSIHSWVDWWANIGKEKTMAKKKKKTKKNKKKAKNKKKKR